MKLLAKAKWLLGRIVDIIIDVVAGILLYLILGGYVSQPLLAISPYLPTLLIISLVFAVIVGFVHRVFKSVKFHGFAERARHDLVDFLHNWDKLNNAFIGAANTRSPEDVGKFEDIRAGLQYSYPKIALAVKMSSQYSYMDHIRGIAIHNYDVIGNLLVKSPFTGMEWFNVSFINREFKEQWDIGRHILISTIGSFDCVRQSTMHQLYWVLHFVPILETQEKASGSGEQQ